MGDKHTVLTAFRCLKLCLALCEYELLDTERNLQQSYINHSIQSMCARVCVILCNASVNFE
jgi:hypothetical protein